MSEPLFDTEPEQSAIKSLGREVQELLASTVTARITSHYGRTASAEAYSLSARGSARRIIGLLFRLFPGLRGEVLKGEVR